MTKRHLFLVGYDITDDVRRARVLRLVKGHTLGGQKSFYECWLTIGELNHLMEAMRGILNKEEDRLVFIRLDPRVDSITIGSGQPINDGQFFYVA